MSAQREARGCSIGADPEVDDVVRVAAGILVGRGAVHAQRELAADRDSYYDTR